MSDLKKDFILDFIRNNPNPSGKEIAAFAVTIGCSKTYVYQVISRNGFFLHSRRDLTPRNYATAIIAGITTIKALSSYFGISESTIKRFEREHRIKQKLDDYNGIWKHDNVAKVSPMGDIISALMDLKDKMAAVVEFNNNAEINTSKIWYIIQFLQDIKP